MLWSGVTISTGHRNVRLVGVKASLAQLKTVSAQVIASRRLVCPVHDSLVTKERSHHMYIARVVATTCMSAL